MGLWRSCTANVCILAVYKAKEGVACLKKFMLTMLSCKGMAKTLFCSKNISVWTALKTPSIDFLKCKKKKKKGKGWMSGWSTCVCVCLGRGDFAALSRFAGPRSRSHPLPARGRGNMNQPAQHSRASQSAAGVWDKNTHTWRCERGSVKTNADCMCLR